MARTERTNVDYFPFLCKEGKAMHYIEHKYGNDGFATWVKILRQIAVTNDHWLNLSDPVEMMFIASKCFVSEEKLQGIISDLCKMGELNSRLWNEKMVVWSDKFIENIQDAYHRRKNKCITLTELMSTLCMQIDVKNKENEEKNDINTHIIIDKNITYKIRGYYFRIQEKIIEEKVSEFLLKNCLIFLNQFDMQNPVPAREEIFIKLDAEYAQHKFDDENHIKNAYKSIKNNWVKKNITEKLETAHKKQFHEKL